jgi:catechol 2,3-dioxygenase-like lactoylglutathione lyase family enzyme
MTMSARVHIHLSVADMARSRDFYEKFFGVGPAKDKGDHLKFVPPFAPINLAISRKRAESGDARAINHLGVEVDSGEAVLHHLERVKAAGLSVREQLNVNCCYANQSKFWVRDPDGVEWEVYHVNYDLEEKHGKPVAGAAPAPRPLPVINEPATSCCSGARSRDAH